MSNHLSSPTWLMSPAIRDETCERTIALWAVLGSLFSRAGSAAESYAIAIASDTLSDGVLAQLGLAAERAANEDMIRGSDAARARVESLRCASSLARLMRLHASLRSRGSASADRILAVAEGLAGARSAP